MEILFAIWVLFVFRAVWNRRPVLWAIVCLIPLLALSLLYYRDIQHGDDPFGVRPAMVLLFIAMCMVVASSGILSMILSHHPVPELELRRRRKTLRQRLWWAPNE